MSVNMLQELDQLSKYREENISAIVGKALEIGVRKLWEETILDTYIKSKLTRNEAIDQLGLDLVKIAEEQREAMKEDVRWGLYGK